MPPLARLIAWAALPIFICAGAAGADVAGLAGLKIDPAQLIAMVAELWEEKALRADMRGRMDALSEDTAVLRVEVAGLKTRMGKCEAAAGGGGEHRSRRRNQQQQTELCGMEAVQSMLGVCCASPLGIGHRLLQADGGCDSLPATCSPECSGQFVSIFENCQGEPVMRELPAGVMAEWTVFYSACSEADQAVAEMGALKPINVVMYRILISSDGAQTHDEMFPGGGQGGTIVGPLPTLPSPPPPPPVSPVSTDVEQYHAQCTTANIQTCVPTCNATTHGYELLATIDGTDTTFSCTPREPAVLVGRGGCPGWLPRPECVRICVGGDLGSGGDVRADADRGC